MSLQSEWQPFTRGCAYIKPGQNVHKYRVIEAPGEGDIGLRAARSTSMRDPILRVIKTCRR